MLQHDFDEKLSSKMKATILVSFLPTDLRGSLIQQADRFVEYQPTKQKVIAIVEPKLAMRSPDEMDVGELAWWNDENDEEHEEIHMVGKGGVQCSRCGGQEHIASTSVPP